MLQAPVPVDEQDRVAALHALQVLDTPPEERFDRLTRLLARLFQVPMAYVSLVDGERQWFKSACGMGVAETPRAVSFCAHAILSDQALVVPDATRDERFHDNPLVTGAPGIRFYAGHPLLSADGHRIGTLCIADRRPRTFNDDDCRTLQEMAQLAQRELNLVEAVQLQQELLVVRARAAAADHEKAECLDRMVESQHLLLRELGEAAEYVRSLLPAPLTGPVRTRWRFEPSSQLGGDCFGYNWIDRNHFAVYLLDVSGHGTGAALLSVSAMNTLRAQALPKADFRNPASVLAHLNDAFPMERQNDKYFTIWYGVFNRVTRRLVYAGAGHPPALLIQGPQADEPHQADLVVPNFAIGILSGAAFTSAGVTVAPDSRLYVFSDGVFEVETTAGGMMNRQDLVRYLTDQGVPRSPNEVWEFVQQAAGGAALKDDFSFLEVTLP